MRASTHDAAAGLGGWAIRAAGWILLGGWFGSWTLFALVIAPTAFQVLPNQQAAGNLVAPVLEVLHKYGIGAGLALGALAAIGRRGWLAISTPILLASVCAFSQYWVTPAIDAVSPKSFGASQEATAAARFSELHQMSRILFGFVEIGVVALIALHARERSRTDGHSG